MCSKDYYIAKQGLDNLSFLEDDHDTEDNSTLIDDDYELIGYGYESRLTRMTKRENIAVSTLLVVVSIAFTSCIYIICVMIIQL